MMIPKQRSRTPQRIYTPPSTSAPEVMEKEPVYMVQCPQCEKRTIDVSELPERPIKLRYKCPHCKRVVIVPLASNKRP